MAVALPLTYPDLVCDLDLDPFASETASDLANLVQDVTHVIIQELGSNPDDPTRGVGIDSYLSGTTDNFKGLPPRIDAMLGVDDRIDAVATTITYPGDSPPIINVTITVNGQTLPLQFGWTDGVFGSLQ